MQWLDRARSIVNGTYGLSLPDPDRIDAGRVPDTATLIRAIDAAMPRTAILQLIGPRNPALIAFLTTRSIARRRSTGEYFLSLEDGSTTELANLAARCAPDQVCAHLFVQDGEHTLLEAFGRDKGEDVVWVSRRLPRSRFRRFLQATSASLPDAGQSPRGSGHSMKEGHTMVRTAPRPLVLLVGLALPALTLLACVQPPAIVIETSTGDVVRLETWTATLSGALHGTVALSPGVTYRETLATITVSGATPRAVHAWYVHLGECGHERGILAGLQPYTPITADEQGTIAAAIALPFTVPTAGEYSVTVRQSEQVNSSPVACGNLTKGRAASPTIAAERPR